MDWDVLYEGFRDEFDLALVDVGDAKGELRAQAFHRGRPVPVLIRDRSLPEELIALAGARKHGEGHRFAVLATPSLRVPIDVEVVDEAGDSRFIRLGTRRIAGEKLRYSSDLERDPYYLMREFTVQALRQAPCMVWDSAILPAGEGFVLRYRVTLRTNDPAKAEALAAERLMVRMLRADATTTEWPVIILEDSTFKKDEGEWRRVVTYAVQAPAPLDDCCFWVWSRVLGCGAFRGFPRWIAELILAEARTAMTSVAHDPGYDSWMKGQQGAAATDDAETPASGVHLRVIVVEEPEAPLAGTWKRALPRAVPSKGELRARTAASLRAQLHRDFDVHFVGAGEPFGARPAQGQTRPKASWSVIVGLGDVLEPQALGEIAAAIEGTNALAVYADEDVAIWAENGSVTYADARLKPRFSHDELYFGNGVGLPLAVAPEVMDPEATCAYELALAALEKGGPERFHHIEKVLLHAAESRPFATGGMVAPLAAHLARRGVSADVVYRETNLEVDPQANVERHPGGVLRIRYAYPASAPLVSVVIPNRDHADYLGPCVRSILELTRYPNFEIVIVENGSSDADILALYAKLQEDARVRVVGWHGEGFNYPSVVNRGVEKARGEYVCLLNNDTVVLDGDWMVELLGPLLRPEIGVTGALLSFPDGLVQHAGMMSDPYGGLGHQQQNLWPGTIAHGDVDGDEGYLMTLQRPVAYTMVTGACQMVSRALFDELGGYDEALSVGYNDADFCLRAAKAGYRTLFTPYARLMHREFGTRHRETTDVSEVDRWKAERALMRERYPEVFARDPFFNRALNPDSRYFALARVFWVFETGGWYGLPFGENY